MDDTTSALPARPVCPHVGFDAGLGARWRVSVRGADFDGLLPPMLDGTLVDTPPVTYALPACAAGGASSLNRISTTITKPAAPTVRQPPGTLLMTPFAPRDTEPTVSLADAYVGDRTRPTWSAPFSSAAVKSFANSTTCGTFGTGENGDWPSTTDRTFACGVSPGHALSTTAFPASTTLPGAAFTASAM